jgi:hypothetical protein
MQLEKVLADTIVAISRHISSCSLTVGNRSRPGQYPEALALIASTKSIGVLLLREKTSKIYMLLSWAPDWTIFNLNLRKPEIYNATRDSNAIYTVSAEIMLLDIKGCLLGVVKHEFCVDRNHTFAIIWRRQYNFTVLVHEA